MSKEEIILERLCAWFALQMFELHQDNIEKLSSLFVEWKILRKLESILDTDSKYYYEMLDANVFTHDIINQNKMKLITCFDIKMPGKNFLRKINLKI